MLYAEHVAAEALRYARLKAYGPRHAQRENLNWFLHLIGLRGA